MEMLTLTWSLSWSFSHANFKLNAMLLIINGMSLPCIGLKFCNYLIQTWCALLRLINFWGSIFNMPSHIWSNQICAICEYKTRTCNCQCAKINYIYQILISFPHTLLRWHQSIVTFQNICFMCPLEGIGSLMEYSHDLGLYSIPYQWVHMYIGRN